MSDSPSPIAPRPRPGFRSRPEVSTADKAALVATTMRSLLGVLCLGVAVLYLPSQMVTPILSGVSVLMIVSGAAGSWQVARREPRLFPYARIVYWGSPLLGVLVFVLMLVVGPSAFGPSWETMTGAQEPARYVPPEELPSDDAR